MMDFTNSTVPIIERKDSLQETNIVLIFVRNGKQKRGYGFALMENHERSSRKGLVGAKTLKIAEYKIVIKWKNHNSTT